MEHLLFSLFQFLHREKNEHGCFKLIVKSWIWCFLLMVLGFTHQGDHLVPQIVLSERGFSPAEVRPNVELHRMWMSPCILKLLHVLLMLLRVVPSPHMEVCVQRWCEQNSKWLSWVSVFQPTEEALSYLQVRRLLSRRVGGAVVSIALGRRWILAAGGSALVSVVGFWVRLAAVGAGRLRGGSSVGGAALSFRQTAFDCKLQ